MDLVRLLCVFYLWNECSLCVAIVCELCAVKRLSVHGAYLSRGWCICVLCVAYPLCICGVNLFVLQLYYLCAVYLILCGVFVVPI